MEEEWSSDANESLELSLRSPSNGKQITTFQPSYTYPIFGEAETVFGYKGLEMRLAFAANDMRPCFDVSWEERMQPKGSVTAEDVEEVVKEFLPTGLLEFPLDRLSSWLGMMS
jgi:histone acetyltransferase 1